MSCPIAEIRAQHEYNINSRGNTAKMSPAQRAPPSEDNDGVDEEDLCMICRLLIYRPIRTRCGHSMCRTCMATWADVSISAPNMMAIVRVDDVPQDVDAATGLEARCPMCRTQTSAFDDDARARELEEKYPDLYSERQSQEQEDEGSQEGVQAITVYLGNSHSTVHPPESQPSNRHQWTFFVRPSRSDIVEEVHIHLHPSFRQNHIIRTRPPYSVQRLGWGYFTILARIILKAGYSWLSNDAEDSPDGAVKGMLTMEWSLDFESFGGTGAMGKCLLKVRNDRNWEDDEAARDRREWERVIRQYERDGRYEPQ